MRIMDCVLLLNQAKMEFMSIDQEKPCPKPSWTESLKMMASVNFLTSLLEFKKDNINEETVELMEPYLRMEDYDLENAKRVAANVAGLLSWTVAMTNFFTVNKEVLPLKDNLKIQEVKLHAAEQELKKAQSQLDEKEKELAVTMQEYNAAMDEKQRLMDDADGFNMFFSFIVVSLKFREINFCCCFCFLFSLSTKNERSECSNHWVG